MRMPLRSGSLQEHACAPLERSGTKASRAKKWPGRPSAGALKGFLPGTGTEGLSAADPVTLP